MSAMFCYLADLAQAFSLMPFLLIFVGVYRGRYDSRGSGFSLLLVWLLVTGETLKCIAGGVPLGKGCVRMPHFAQQINF